MCDTVAALPGLAGVHPAAPASLSQGWLALLVELEEVLCEITGMAAATLQPAAGAAGELTGLLLMRAWHEAQGSVRHKVIIPDSAHGTNPASVTLGGYEVVTVPSDERGCVDMAALADVLDEDVAGIMLTNPNTLGLFEEDIAAIAAAVHERRGPALLRRRQPQRHPGRGPPGGHGLRHRPHEPAQDVRHPPRRGRPRGRPGGRVRATGAVPPRTPARSARRPTTSSPVYEWVTPPRSIGRVHTWHGNSLVLARALAYILANGGDGLRRIAETAVLNANWIRQRLTGTYDVPFDRPCMHEVVLSVRTIKQAHGVRALDVAKRLLEEGFHSPTVYFPLIVDEALMIEPTETESPQTLEALAESLERIAYEAATDRAGMDGRVPPPHPGAQGGRGPGGPHPHPHLRRPDAERGSRWTGSSPPASSIPTSASTSTSTRGPTGGSASTATGCRPCC